MPSDTLTPTCHSSGAIMTNTLLLTRKSLTWGASTSPSAGTRTVITGSRTTPKKRGTSYSLERTMRIPASRMLWRLRSRWKTTPLSTGQVFRGCLGEISICALRALWPWTLHGISSSGGTTLVTQMASSIESLQSPQVGKGAWRLVGWIGKTWTITTITLTMLSKTPGRPTSQQSTT